MCLSSTARGIYFLMEKHWMDQETCMLAEKYIDPKSLSIISLYFGKEVGTIRPEYLSGLTL